MSNVWMIVADAMSASNVAGIAVSAGAPVDALVFGDAKMAEDVAKLGVATVTRYDVDATLAEAYAPAIAEKAAAEAPAAVILSDNATARALAGAIAVKVGAAVATSVVSVSIADAQATVEQLVAEGEGVQVLKTSAPVVCVIADGGPDAEEGAAVAVQDGVADAIDALKVVATNAEGEGAAGLLTAEKVVGVGLGIGGKENLALVNDLADALGAAVACTLPLCDNYHWFEHSSVVGTSTQKISPRLYLCCGSSGAPQHMAGVRSAKVIVAINNDPEAPIFRECSYGIVGDAVKVLPVLTSAVKGA